MKTLLIAAGLALAGIVSADGARAAAVDPSGDLAHIRPLLNQTLETEKSGIEVRWSNPETRNRGMMRVERTFYRDDRPCRDYVRSVERSGKSGWVIRGMACRVGPARWEIQDEIPTATEARERSGASRPAPAQAEPRAATRPARPAPARSERTAPTPAPAAAAAGSGPKAPTARDAEPFVAFTRPARTGL